MGRRRPTRVVPNRGLRRPGGRAQGLPEAADRVVLDVRRGSEFDAGHIDGAVNLPIHTVLSHLDSIPHKKLWVHCAAGYRASVVASILAARGHDVVAVDDSFDENAAKAGLPVV